MKKSVAALLSLLLALSLCLGCSTTNAEDEPVYPVYETYTDIPGVTQEEIAAIESLRERSDTFSIGVNETTESFYRTDGTIGGYSSLFCSWLSDLFDMSFMPKIVEWDVLLEGLASGQIDFTSELTATEERRKTYYMTDAIAERSIKSFRLVDSPEFSELIAERDLHYAFLDGATASGYVAESSEYPFTPTYVQDYREAVQLLRDGSIDAFFEDSPAEAAFASYADIVIEDYYPLIYTPVSLSTANPELAPVISVVQKYLEQGAIYYLTELYNLGDQEYQQHKLYSTLTDEERAYLKEHSGGVLYAAEFDNYPVSFYNTNEQEWQGIAHDVLNEISELTGLAFVVENAPGATWSELFSDLEEGNVALITELIPSAERQDHYLWPDDPYSEDSFALISLENHEVIQVNQIWYSSVAVAKDTAYEEVFDAWFPDHQNVLRVSTTGECFDALENGTVDFVMASRNLILSMTNYQEKSGFKVNILFGKTYGSSFGLNVEEKLLCSIISKAQNQVDTESITNQWVYRVFDYNAKLVRTQQGYLTIVAVILVAVLVLVIVLLIRRRRGAIKLEELVGQRTAELEVQTEAAQQASRAKSEFLSQMSHEIRTPLNAIIGMAQISKQVPDVPEKAQMANEKMLSASHHLLDILNDILDMAKIESGKFVLAYEPFALELAMEDVGEIIAQRCREKEITFERDFDGLLDISIIGDKLRLKQVLINLLGNAVKFTDKEGTIRFAVKRTKETEQEVTLSFSVKDNGIGMTKDQIARLFVAFSQADTTTAVKYGGTGLGLAISQNMVQKMGGEIKVESEPGEGSRFWFTLTFEKTALVNEAEEGASAPLLKGKRILLVEDMEVNRLIAIELLSETKADIEETEDGQEALEFFEASPEGYYDLILMDIQMPRMDGYETARTIRALDREDAQKIPIIAMTANAFSEDVQKALESGMNGHIAKPIDIRALYSTIGRYITQE